MLLDKSLEELELHLWRKWRDHDQAQQSDSLTFNELDYLEFIDKHKTLRLTDLANGLGITKASASAMISKLEKRGLIIRSSDDKDGRTTNLMLSPEGEKLKETEVALYKRAAILLQNTMSDDDYQSLQSLLAKACRILVEESNERLMS